MITTLVIAAGAAALAGTLDADLRAVAALRGEPSLVSAAGITPLDVPILTLENPDAFDPAATKRRLVLIGVDGAPASPGSADAVIGAVRWFKTRAPAALRRQWAVSALPSADFDPANSRSLTRWVTFQAPNLVVTIGGTSSDAVRDALKGVPYKPIGVPQQLETILAANTPRSTLHDELVARVQRDPLALAGLLARRYPEAPGISYIPALSWVNTLRLAAITRDDSLREKVRQQIQPLIEKISSGEQKLFGDRIQLTAVAGTMIFADLAVGRDDGAAARLADEGAALAAARKTSGIAEYGQGWTDDMFMAASVLARASLRPGHQDALDAAARLLADYAERLQQPSGLFHHAVDGPAAWGRGNGFAAFGLMDVLSVMPEQHPSRAALLEIYRRQMAAVKAQQAPDGAWREVIDAPGAYREESATAMLMTAMARGVRLGWIDRSYLPTVQRAWRALAAHVAADGTIVDVCAGTGAGPTRRYYLDRPAVTGADDRGGAMALFAAVEMYELAKKGR
jgi:hypothetical protein